MGPSRPGTRPGGDPHHGSLRLVPSIFCPRENPAVHLPGQVTNFLGSTVHSHSAAENRNFCLGFPPPPRPCTLLPAAETLQSQPPIPGAKILSGTTTLAAQFHGRTRQEQINTAPRSRQRFCSAPLLEPALRPLHPHPSRGHPTTSPDPQVTESQNGRGWKGPLWVTQPNPLPKQGHPQQAAQDLI